MDGPMRLAPLFEVTFLRRGLAAVLLLALPIAVPAALAQPKPPPVPAGPKPGPTPSAPPRRPAGPRPAPPPSATAAVAPAPDPGEGDELSRLYNEGYNAFQAGEFEKAEQRLQRAWALSKSYDIAGTLGSAKLELGKYREAALYLSFALRNALPSTRATVRDRIKRDLDGARTHLATIKLTVNLAEAKVAIDGAIVDPLFLGAEVYVDPGKRNFEAMAEGYTTATSSIEVKAGEVQVVTLTLERTAAPKGGGTAPPPAPTTQSTPLPAAILGGAGGLAIIVGAVLIGAAESSKRTAYDLSIDTLTPDGNPTCPRQGPGPTERCDDLRSSAQNADAFGNVGIGVFIGAGVLIAGATAYMLFRPEPPPGAQGEGAPGPTSQIVPVVGTSGGGVVWQGRF